MVQHRRTLHPPIEPFRRGFLRVSDVHEVYFEESGTPTGKPALYIHGGPGIGADSRARRLFDPMVYRIIVFDQRGCGRSRPRGSLTENSTWHLVADIEALRTHLQIERWLLFGGSWGCSLALAYAQAHPQCVTELVLRGIFLLRTTEIRWMYRYGASELFPDSWESYVGCIPHDERDDLLRAYHRRLTSPDKRIAFSAARAWSAWETCVASAGKVAGPMDTAVDDELELSVARIKCHYFSNRGFLPCETQLIDEVPIIRHLPATLIHGRDDLMCPMRSAWDLHRAWPEADLRLVPDAGHSAFDAATTEELLLATERYNNGGWPRSP